MTPTGRLIGMVSSAVGVVLGATACGLLLLRGSPFSLIPIVLTALSAVTLIYSTGFVARWSGGYTKFNGDWPSTRQTTLELFSAARQYIKILSGSLDSSFYSDPQVIEALQYAIVTHQVHIRILVGSGFKTPDGPLLDLLRQHPWHVALRVLPYRPKRHFIVVDDADYRRERPHPPLIGGGTPHATIYYDDPEFAVQFSRLFDDLERSAFDWTANEAA